MKRFNSFFEDQVELSENAPIEVDQSAAISDPNSQQTSQNAATNASEMPNTALDAPKSVNDATNVTSDAAGSAGTAFTEFSEATSSQNDNDGAESDAGVEQATLPTAIANRPPTQMKARYSGHAIFNDLVRRDWQRAIATDPMAFDALLYVPTDASEHDIEPGEDAADEPAFTELSPNQKTLTYGDPVLVAVLDCPDESLSFTATDADGEQDGGVDEVMALRIAPPLDVINGTATDLDHPIARAFVPVGSILEWNESLANGEVSRSWWYVHHIATYGTAAVGSIYFCIPARNYDAITEAAHA